MIKEIALMSNKDPKNISAFAVGAGSGRYANLYSTAMNTPSMNEETQKKSMEAMNFDMVSFTGMPAKGFKKKRQSRFTYSAATMKLEEGNDLFDSKYTTLISVDPHSIYGAYRFSC